MAFKQGCRGISPVSCSPPSLGIVPELHARAEGMGSCRGKRGKEHRRREESKEEETQPWLVGHGVSGLVGDGFGCVVFLQQIDNISSAYSRTELGATTRSAGRLGFERISPAKRCELQRAAGGFPALRPGVGFIPSAPGETRQIPSWVTEVLKRGCAVGLAWVGVEERSPLCLLCLRWHEQDEPLPSHAAVSLRPSLVSIGLLQFSLIKSEIIGS